MAIARVQAGNSGLASAVSNTSAVSLAGVGAGNGLIVIAANHSSVATSVSGVSDTHNTFTQLTGAAITGASGVVSDIWVCKNVVTGGALTITVTWAAALGGCATIVLEVSGEDTVSFWDKIAGATGNSTAPNSGATAATSQANEFCVGVVANVNNNIATAPTFSTGLVAVTTETFADETVAPKVGLSVFDGILASSGVAETFSATVGTGQWNCHCLTFLNAAAAAPFVPKRKMISYLSM